MENDRHPHQRYVCINTDINFAYNNHQAVPSKKRKAAPASKNAHQKNGVKPKAKGKEKASDRGIIPIPVQTEGSEDESDLEDQDLGILEQYGANAGFLQSLDQTGISR